MSVLVLTLDLGIFTGSNNIVSACKLFMERQDYSKFIQINKIYHYQQQILLI